MGSLRLTNVQLMFTGKVILLVENHFILIINRIAQNINKDFF